MCIREQIILIQWGRNKMAAILQTTIPNTLSWMMNEKRIKFHYCLIVGKPSLVQIMACRLFGAKPLFEALMARLIDKCSGPRCVYQNAEVDYSTNNYIPQHSLAAYILCLALPVEFMVPGWIWSRWLYSSGKLLCSVRYVFPVILTLNTWEVPYLFDVNE